MAEVLQPYNAGFINTLPDLPTAEKSFVTKGGPDLVDKVLKPMIERYQLESKLGVGLLRHHFELEDSEKLVELNNISLPWTSNSDDRSDGKILPSAWAVKDGGLTPYEFYYSPLGRDTHFNVDTAEPFTLSLRLFPGEGFSGALETTEGRPNINLLPDQVSDIGWNDSIETMWFFDPKSMKEKRVCRCSKTSTYMHIHGNM